MELESPSIKRCRGPGEPMLSHFDSSEPVPAQDCGSLSQPLMAPFTPRPFPPPSLSGVPVEYIVDQLHNLAPLYWNKTETADCTIIVPVPHPRVKPVARFPPDALPIHEHHALGRRVSEPSLHFVPRITMKLHVDYLSAHSSLLRGLFSGMSPLDLINTTPGSLTAYNPPSRTPSGQPVPANRLPRLLPSPPNHPTLFLPLPDPSSFHLLAHWMYFGSTEYIAEALAEGTIQWEGIARNVEYLGLPTDIKVFLGRWYGNWLHPERSRCEYDDLSDDGDSDTACDSDCNFDDDSDTASDMEAEFENYKEPCRGRTRETRRLSSITSRLQSM